MPARDCKKVFLIKKINGKSWIYEGSIAEDFGGRDLKQAKIKNPPGIPEGLIVAVEGGFEPPRGS
jgi:hypothetical protein